MSPIEVKAALAARRKAHADGPRSVTDLARATGLNRTAIQGWINGRRGLPATAEAAIKAALPEAA